MADTLFTRTPRDQLPEQYHLAWDTMNRLTEEPTFVEVFASNPSMLDFVMNDFYSRVFFGGRVDQRYKQLARLKLSLLHGCRTCNRQNVPGALEAGVSQAQIDAMRDYENGPFTAAEKAVIAYADEVALTNMDGRMTPELYARLRSHFSEADILELGVAMAVVSGWPSCRSC
jgi:alkylhydroperoxidase family enzyme